MTSIALLTCVKNFSWPRLALIKGPTQACFLPSKTGRESLLDAALFRDELYACSINNTIWSENGLPPGERAAQPQGVGP
jgi:hypothetical protein